MRYGNSASPNASRSPLQHPNVLRQSTTSILKQGRCSSFVNMTLGRSHYPYKSQRSTHCSRLTRVMSQLAAPTHLTVLVYVHKPGSSRTHQLLAIAVLPVLFYPTFVFALRIRGNLDTSSIAGEEGWYKMTFIDSFVTVSNDFINREAIRNSYFLHIRYNNTASLCS